MLLIVQQGATSVRLQVFIADATVTTGAGKTGLAYNTGSLTAYYFRDGDTSATAIALVTASLGTFTSSGFIVVDGTNMPGWYEIGIPNAVFANAVRQASVMIKLAGTIVPVNIMFQLVPWNPQDGVRLGLTALPNAAAGANGGVPTGNASGQVTIGGYASGEDPATLLLVSPTHLLATNSSGQVDLDMAQSLSNTQSNGTLGEALIAARAQGFGAWTVAGTTLTLYGSDGTTVVRTFSLNSSSNPTSRT